MGTGPSFVKSSSSRSFNSSSDANSTVNAAQLRAKSFAAQGAAGMYGSVGKGQGFSAGIIGSSRGNGKGNGVAHSPRSNGSPRSKSYNNAPNSQAELTTPATSVPVQRLTRAGSGGKRPESGVGAALGGEPEAHSIHPHHNKGSSSSSSQMYGSNRNLSPRAAATHNASCTTVPIRKNSTRGRSFNGGGSSVAPFGTDLTAEAPVTPRRFGTSKPFGSDAANDYPRNAIDNGSRQSSYQQVSFQNEAHEEVSILICYTFVLHPSYRI